MGVKRWLVSTFTTLAVAAVAAGGTVAVGVTGAFAQASDAGAAAPEELLERLAALEPELPADPGPQRVTIAEEDTWGSLGSDPGTVSDLLASVEPELRELFVDADDADGDVAEAVASVARGWLEIWQGTTALAVWDTHDLAFPTGTFDADGVATGADERRGDAVIGLELVLSGRDRHTEGYTALRTLAAAEPAAQALVDDRAASAEQFERQVRPQLLAMLSQESSVVIVPTGRFETDAPGVEPRATSMHVTCVDREALEELGGVVTAEVLAELDDASTRTDCPALADDAAAAGAAG